MDEPSATAKKTKSSKNEIQAGLKTASELLESDRVPLNLYREGSTVRHPEYGEGTITSLVGRGPKRTAKIRFDDATGEQTFRLAFANLKLVQ